MTARLIMAEVNVGKALKEVGERIKAAANRRPEVLKSINPRLVAVSKTKPKELVLAAYEAGQRNFGENYVQELVDKANDPEILEKCKDIKWHYIGHLQRNKVNKLLSAKNLYVVETLDSEKLADALNNSWEKTGSEEPLRVMVQVNTSGEEQKNGVEPSQVNNLVDYIIKENPNLKFFGLMTIGMAEYDPTAGPNPDFTTLVKCKTVLCESVGLDCQEVELSMGMSSDFEQAIEMGSSNVRVGSTIFGARNYPAKT